MSVILIQGVALENQSSNGKLSLETIDHSQGFNWGQTSKDYAKHRPGPPLSFYDKLNALGVGLPGQRMLDLATGTGVVIREFVKRGVIGHGIDVASEQIEMAQSLAANDGLSVTFKVSRAEEIPYYDTQFNIIIANQCWWYFDVKKVIAEARRLLTPQGLLVVSQFNYLPSCNHFIKKTEELVLKYNPKWTGADWDGVIPPMPEWAVDDFNLRGMFYYDEAIPFTHESWRGRIRACRGVAASLRADQVDEFDAEHAEWLRVNVPDPFVVVHRIDAHILEFKFAREM